MNDEMFDFFDTDADMEDYGFEYSEEEPEEQDVDIENQYYNSKGFLSFLFFTISLLVITYIGVL